MYDHHSREISLDLRTNGWYSRGTVKRPTINREWNTRNRIIRSAAIDDVHREEYNIRYTARCHVVTRQSEVIFLLEKHLRWLPRWVVCHGFWEYVNHLCILYWSIGKCRRQCRGKKIKYSFPESRIVFWVILFLLTLLSGELSFIHINFHSHIKAFS